MTEEICYCIIEKIGDCDTSDQEYWDNIWSDSLKAIKIAEKKYESSKEKINEDYYVLVLEGTKNKYGSCDSDGTDEELVAVISSKGVTTGLQDMLKVLEKLEGEL